MCLVLRAPSGGAGEPYTKAAGGVCGSGDLRLPPAHDFQETGLQDPQGMVRMENQWRHHGYHAFLGVDTQAASAAAVRGGLLIALLADVFAAKEVRDVVDIVPGKAMALDVVTAGGTFTVINVHSPGSGGDS